MKKGSRKNSRISLRGEVTGQDKSGYLLLRNEQGFFRVKLTRQTEIPIKGSQVQVVGTLHSFVFSRCRRHHHYIKAESYSPAPEAGDMLSLVLPWLVQV